MAISINPLTYVIYVPRADLTLLQASPEVRELNVNQFRLWLKDLEDDPDYGIYLYKTHNHNTEVELAGLTYARIIEILPPYTVEFEDGQYTVNCVGANHNISDVKVANQVSLIVNNAAGLITNAQIEFASFNGGVSVDLSGPYSGTVFPTGTPQRPVNNWLDAFTIAATRGFATIFVIGTATLDDSADFSDFQFVGESKTRTFLTIEEDATVDNCNFHDMFIEGFLDGNATLVNCRVGDLNYVRGCVDRCVLNGSSITLLGDAIFLDSFSGNPADGVPEINLGGSGKSLILKNYNGSIKLTNKTGSEESEIDLNSGVVQLDNTVTGGTVHVRGVGTVDPNGATATINTTGLLNTDTISTGVMAETVEGSLDLQAALQILLAVIAGKATGGGTTAITFRNTADDTNRVVMTVDTNGNRSSVVLNT